MGEESQKKTTSGFSFKSVFSRLVGSLSPPAENQAGPFWNKLPRMLNLGPSRATAAQGKHVLDYEPMHLQINPMEVYPSAIGGDFRESGMETGGNLSPVQPLTLESFRFLMDQVPAIRTIEFSGRHRDPLENPDLLRMVDYAVRFTGADCTVFTDGLRLEALADALLESRLRTLVVRMVAHRPSGYSRFTGLSGALLVEVRRNLDALLKKREPDSTVEIELSMQVDIHNYRDIPELIRCAEALNVDGLRLDNFLSPNPLESSDRTLYTYQKNMMRFLEEVKASLLGSRMPVTLPVPLDADMSGHRRCPEPYNTVSVDAEFNISGCSRQLLLHPQSGKIWDADFFNNPMYQWLRAAHNARLPKGGVPPEAPLACRNCPRNMP